MDTKTTFRFFERFWDDNLGLIYDGSFDDDVTDKVIALSEYNIANYITLKKMKKRVSFLMAECFQNVIRHGEKPASFLDIKGDPGFFLTKNCNQTFYIAIGNLIKKKNIDGLQSQLDVINKLDKDGIKELFRNVLETGEFSDKGGAGLGLIDMARRSGNKIEYLFKEYDDEYSFFYNQISLKPDDDDPLTCNGKSFTLDDAIEYHDHMHDENILVINKGDFSQDSIIPVLNILEKNLHEIFEQSYSKKEVYHVLVELLQNVSKHCHVVDGIKEGIFLIGKNEKTFIINTGNFILKKDVKALKDHLNLLNSLNKEDLKKLFIERLQEGSISVKGGAGIGLIDIARRRKDPIRFNFNNIDDEKDFFSISVTI